MSQARPNDLEFMDLGRPAQNDDDPFKIKAHQQQQQEDPFSNLVLNTAPQRGEVLDNFFDQSNAAAAQQGGNTTSSSAGAAGIGGTFNRAGDRAYQQLQESGAMPEFIKNAKHPGVCLFHLLFKVLCLVVYLFGSWFWNGFVLTFIFCILLLAVDFWTVKNVTGRKLVGLRWWSISKEVDGREQEEWCFESLQDESQLDPLDRTVFWFGLYAWPVIWVFFLILNVLKFNLNWCVLIVVALIFSGSNLVGYWKCSGDQRQKMQNLSKGIAGTAIQNMTGFNIGNYV